MFSLDKKMIDLLLEETLPSYQATCKESNNLGFGFLYYSMVRALRPSKTIVIGSKAGFSVTCFGLGIKDNEGHTIANVNCYDTPLTFPTEKAKLHFIDPSFSYDRGDENHWYGIGHWDSKEKVDQQWKKYEIHGIVEHFKVTSKEYLKSNQVLNGVDLLYIDGDHSYEGITHDFNAFYDILKKDAIVIAHDVDPALA